MFTDKPPVIALLAQHYSFHLMSHATKHTCGLNANYHTHTIVMCCLYILNGVLLSASVCVGRAGLLSQVGTHKDRETHDSLVANGVDEGH